MIHINRSIVVTWTQANMHHWPNAPEHRDYLAATHRHLFHYSVQMDVEHNDREVEFHDLLDQARAAAIPADTDAGSMSCEAMAAHVGDHLVQEYPGRALAVAVSKDGENGAQVRYTPAFVMDGAA